MSDGATTCNHRITMSYFRTCSTCRSRSQAPLYHCALHMIADHAEGTFEVLRYFLGGNRPSQTDHLTLSSTRLHGPELELRLIKAGISLTTPSRLTPGLPSLPAMLHMTNQNPMSEYSKRCTGSFRPTAGIRHFHRKYNFTEILVETVPRSLHDSCRSELTRQGISLP